MQLIPEDLTTVKEVAAALRVHPSTVTRWIARGAVNATRVGGQWRFAPGDLAAVVHRVEARTR